MKKPRVNRMYHVCFERDDIIYYVQDPASTQLTQRLPFEHVRSTMNNRAMRRSSTRLFIPFTTDVKNALTVNAWCDYARILDIIRRQFKQSMPRGQRPDIFTQRLRG